MAREREREREFHASTQNVTGEWREKGTTGYESDPEL